MKKNIKNIIIFVIILAILGVAYFVFFGKSATPPAATSNSALQTSTTGAAPVNSVINPNALTGAEATKISQEFVNQLLNLQAIKLNDDILSSLAFQSLQDFSIILVQPGNEGRPNPFAPFGSDGSEANASGTPSGVIIPGDSSTMTVWTTAPVGSANISYDMSWTKTDWMDGTPAVIVGYHFALPGGAATLNYAGPQSTCTSTTYPSFAYGVSTKACVKMHKAELTTTAADQTFTVAEKNAFGDFVQKNK